MLVDIQTLIDSWGKISIQHVKHQFAGRNTQHMLLSFYHFIVIECCHSGLMQVLGYTQAPDGRLKLRLII